METTHYHLRKADAKDAISGLKTEGIRKTVMLTGDSKKVAENVCD